MRLSISFRIFLGFMVVLVAFGGVTGYTFYRVHRLRQDQRLINKTYLPLAVYLAEIDTTQSNLLNNLANIIPASTVGGDLSRLRHQARMARAYQLARLNKALGLVDKSRGLGLAGKGDPFLVRVEQQLRRIQQALQHNEPLFDQLFPGPEPAKQQLAKQVHGKLLRLEHRLRQQVQRLRKDVRAPVDAAAKQVEEMVDNAVWAILFTTVIAVLVSLAVTIGSQLTLRPLRSLVAGTVRIGSGDYSHRVEIRSRDELGALGEEFNKMATAIEEREQRLIRSERMAAAGQIASHITHEIRNPLSSISLNTELLEEELEGQEAQKAAEGRRLCEAIRREVDRLTEITEEYLRFARLPKPRLEQEDVNEILLDLLSFVSTELRERQIQLVQALAPELPAVEADENQLRQAFLNLLRNAGEAMAAQGGSLEISTRLVDGQGAVEVRIADTGVGISEQNLSKLFEPFFSTKEAGTGLGLPLTQQIIQEHGGTIEVASTPGRGTVFTVRLPTARNREILEAPAAEEPDRLP
jgi:two-component system NtrC family sensor kinase